MRDYYYILGIDTSASEKEIKSAYRKLSLKFHPDRNDGDKFFEEWFKDIQEAYEVLSNPTKKRDYDFKLDQYRSSRANVDDLRAYEQELKRRFDAELRKREEEIRRSYQAPVSRNQQETDTRAHYGDSADGPPPNERANKKASPRLVSILVALVVIGLIILSSIGIIHRTRIQRTDPNQIAANRNMLPDNSSSGSLSSSSSDSKTERSPEAANLRTTGFGETPPSEMEQGLQHSSLSQDSTINKLTPDNVMVFVPTNPGFEVEMVRLTGNQQPEAVVTYLTNPEGSSEPIAGFKVMQYDSTRKQWQEIFSPKLPDIFNGLGFGFLDRGNLFNNEKEQAIIGDCRGSGMFLDYLVIGTDKEGKISIIKENSGLYMGRVAIENGSLIDGENTQGTKYTWNGTEFISSPVLINPDTNLAKEGDIIIEYSIDKNDSITANYPNHTVFTTKPGTHIFFIRRNHNGVVERILGPGNIADYDYTWVTNKFGEGSFSIVPSGYTWEHAFQFDVICKTSP